MDESERLDRAGKAEKIVNDPIYLESFAAVRVAILSQIEVSPARDMEGREYLYKLLKALNDAKGYLEQMMNDGKVIIHLKEEKRRFSLFR